MVVDVFRKADEHCDAAYFGADIDDSLLGAFAQAGMEKQVLWRIATDTELGKDNEIRQHLVACTFGNGDYFRRIAGDVTHDQIGLGHGNYHFAAHCCRRLTLRSEPGVCTVESIPAAKTRGPDGSCIIRASRREPPASYCRARLATERSQPRLHRAP